jgi:hypothetical protein
MSACLIFHNMCVSDRVMGDARKVYDPSAYVNHANSESSSVDYNENEDDIEYPEDLLEMQGYTNPRHQSQSGSQYAPPETVKLMTRWERWADLKDDDEFQRLHMALSTAISK